MVRQSVHSRLVMTVRARARASPDVESYWWLVDDDGRKKVDEAGEEVGGDDSQDDPAL